MALSVDPSVIEDVTIPDPIPNIKEWTILGIDPSMSRTGYALLNVSKQETEIVTQAAWSDIGSIRGDSDTPEWIRAKAYAEHMRNKLLFSPRNKHGHGLIVAMEYPTPDNTFLVQLNRIIHLVLFQQNTLIPGWNEAGERQWMSPTLLYNHTRVLMLNASTVRSVMGLKQRGAKNKAENMLRAYDFIDRTVYPGLDTDSCDGVLMAMFGRHTASIAMGSAAEVPTNFLTVLCSNKQDVKRKGRPTEYTVTRGLLHRPEYWSEYKFAPYQLAFKDAHIPSGKKLASKTYYM